MLKLTKNASVNDEREFSPENFSHNCLANMPSYSEFDAEFVTRRMLDLRDNAARRGSKAQERAQAFENALHRVHAAGFAAEAGGLVVRTLARAANRQFNIVGLCQHEYQQLTMALGRMQ